jgi:hypothetical protein
MGSSPHFPRLTSAIQKSGHAPMGGRLVRPNALHAFRTKFPMDLTTTSERPRKRRAINACVNCRTSKVRCDGKRPCQRCERNSAACQYYDTVRDDSTLRIEKLEAEVATLRHEMNNFNNRQDFAPTTISSSNNIRERRTSTNAIDSGVITWEQATSWYQR